MSIWEHLELYMRKSHGESLPQIRYFDGTESFSTLDGCYKAKTLEESLKAFLRERVNQLTKIQS